MIFEFFCQWNNGYNPFFFNILYENMINALFFISLVAEFGSFSIFRNIIFFIEDNLIFKFSYILQKRFVCNCSTIRNILSFDEMKNVFILFFLFRPFFYKLQLCLSFLRKNTIMYKNKKHKKLKKLKKMIKNWL